MHMYKEDQFTRVWSTIRSTDFWGGISLLRSDIPCTSPVGPLQAERPELTLCCKSLTLRDFVAAFRHPSPPAAGRSKTQIKNGDQVKLVAIFLVLCGERGIRTPGPVKINGFQDRRIRPLCHLSSRVPFRKGMQRYELNRNLQIIF